jgi:peptidyl-prolyl cis-trans isomerase C
MKQVRASHILVKKESEAKKILEDLKKGSNFAELAKNHSECPSRKRGGDLGWFGRGKMVPEFEKAAFSLKKGDISDPVKTQFGYHIIRVTDTK